MFVSPSTCTPVVHNSHFWAAPPVEGAGHRWWPVGFAYRALQQCWTMPTLPPFARWPLGVSSVEGGCSEPRHQRLPGSAGLSRSLYSQWSGEPGSGVRGVNSEYLTTERFMLERVFQRAKWAKTTLPWHWAPCGSWAPPVEGWCQFLPQHQYGHCHHLRDRRSPSMHQTRCPYHWGGAAGSAREAPEGTVWASPFWTLNAALGVKDAQTSDGHLPAWLQTMVDTGSYCDTSWTMSMLDCGGSQPGMIEQYDRHYTAAKFWLLAYSWGKIGSSDLTQSSLKKKESAGKVWKYKILESKAWANTTLTF